MALMTFGSNLARMGATDFSGQTETNPYDDAYLMDNALEEDKSIRGELVEMQNAGEIMEEMKDELVQAKVNYADAAGETAPEEVEVDGITVASVPGGTISELETDGATEEEVASQVETKVVELDTTVENLMGRLMKTSAYNAKERLGVRTRKSKKLDLQSISRNPMAAYSHSIEDLAETIKNVGKNLWEWLKNLWKRIVDNLKSFFPFFKNSREKGEDIIKKCKNIKRPALKNDEKGDWSERFVVTRLFFKKGKPTDLFSKTMPLDAINNVEKVFDHNTDSVQQLSYTLSTIMGQSTNLGTLDDIECRYGADSNIKYDAKEVNFIGFPTYDLSVYGYNEDNLKEYKDYLLHGEDDDKEIRLEFGLYRLEFKENDSKKKKCEEKISARELVDFAQSCGEVLREVGRFKENVEKVEVRVKKLIEKVDDVDLDKLSSSRSSLGFSLVFLKDTIQKILRGLLGCYSTMTSFPKLITSVANEALAAVKDDD